MFKRNACIALGSVILCFLGLQARADENVVNIYNWSEYIGEDTVANFEKETGIKVRYDNFDSMETLHAKLVAGKTGYDVVVSAANWARMQADGGLFQKLEKTKITSYGNIDPWVLKQLSVADKGNQYVVPWLWGFTTLGINTAKVKVALGGMPMPANVWDLLFNPAYAQKLKACGISVIDSPDEVFPAALRYLGKSPYSKVTADYQDAAKLLSTVRPYITLFSSSGYINDLASGSLCLALGWNGDIGMASMRAKESKNGQTIQALIPENGATMFFDAVAIPSDAPHPENAYKWLSYIYRPDVQAGIVNKVMYANGVRASDKLIKPEVFNNKTVFLDPLALNKMVPAESVNNDVRRIRARLYTTFKTGL